MNPKSDYIHKRYGPMREKSLQNALSQRIAKDFPRLGGERIRQLCAASILAVVKQHLRPREHVQHGQVVWLAVSLNDPPARKKRLRDTELVPVILDLSTTADVQAILERVKPQERLRRKAIRLSEQAHAQGALLSNVDLAVLLNRADSQIAALLAAHERQSQTLIPRRATLHDCGSGLTHKAIICRKHLEGKTADQIARETQHSLTAVDRYLSDFARVRHCRQLGMSPEQIAFTLNHSHHLVQQYLDLEQELQSPIVKELESNNG
jgi:hypothetical protein